MKHLIKWSGIATAIGIEGWLLYDNFITLDQPTGIKIGFGGLVAGFIAFLVGWGKISRNIGRKLQAIETAHEMSVVGKTSMWYATALQWVGVVTPLALAGGMFYFAENYFQDIGETVLMMTAVLAVPIASSFVFKQMERSEMIVAENQKQQRLVSSVADEVKRRVVDVL